MEAVGSIRKPMTQNTDTVVDVLPRPVTVRVEWIAGALATTADPETRLSRRPFGQGGSEPRLRDEGGPIRCRILRRRGVPRAVRTTRRSTGPIAREGADDPWPAGSAIPWDVDMAIGDIAIGSL